MSADEGSKIHMTGRVDLSSVDAMFATTIERLTRLGERMDDRFDSQDKTIGEIKEQTTKSNGRIGKLEGRTEAIEQYKASIQNRVIGFIAAGTVMGGLIGWAVESGLRLTYK